MRLNDRSSALIVIGGRGMTRCRGGEPSRHDSSDALLSGPPEKPRTRTMSDTSPFEKRVRAALPKDHHVRSAARLAGRARGLTCPRPRARRGHRPRETQPAHGPYRASASAPHADCPREPRGLGGSLRRRQAVDEPLRRQEEGGDQVGRTHGLRGVGKRAVLSFDAAGGARRLERAQRRGGQGPLGACVHRLAWAHVLRAVARSGCHPDESLVPELGRALAPVACALSGQLWLDWLSRLPGVHGLGSIFAVAVHIALRPNSERLGGIGDAEPSAAASAPS